MTELDLYVLILCIIVYVALVSVFSALVIIIAKMSLRLIRIGAEDERLIKEHLEGKEKRGGCLSTIIDRTVSFVICALLVICFLVSMTVSLSEGGVCCASLPSIRVVKSASMATREEDNEYLFENNLTDQIQTFDLILTHSMPPEDELELYDIVVYEVKGEYIIHRIVGIEEPNEKHPDERYFLLQGDAVRFSDKFPVKYEQMLGIYRGERIAAVGSFVAFMQSPAGFLCFILALFALIVVPILEKKFRKEELLRLEILEASGALCDNNDKLCAIPLAEVVSEAEAEPEAEVEPEVEAEPEAEVEPEAEAKLEAEVEPEVEVEPEAEAEPEAEVEPEAEEKMPYNSAPVGTTAKSGRKKKDIKLFLNRLALLDADSLSYYHKISDGLEKHRELKCSYSKTYRTFRLCGKPILRLTVKGRMLYCYLAESCGFDEELKKVASYDPNVKYNYTLAVTSEDIADLVLLTITSSVAAIPKAKTERRGEVITVVENGRRRRTFRFIE